MLDEDHVKNPADSPSSSTPGPQEKKKVSHAKERARAAMGDTASTQTEWTANEWARWREQSAQTN
eukprot:5994538-Alexandrium_andersonii.AAC.1